MRRFDTEFISHGNNASFNKAASVNVTLIEKQNTNTECSPEEKPANQCIVYKMYCVTFA